jgi:hypothetical protein
MFVMTRGYLMATREKAEGASARVFFMEITMFLREIIYKWKNP